MKAEDFTSEGIIKKENVGYLKSKIDLMEGVLVITHKHLFLEVHKTGLLSVGFLGKLLHNENRTETIFNLALNSIRTVARGRIGLLPNILEITDTQNKAYRIVVQNYDEWEKLIGGEIVDFSLKQRKAG